MALVDPKLLDKLFKIISSQIDYVDLQDNGFERLLPSRFNQFRNTLFSLKQVQLNNNDLSFSSSGVLLPFFQAHSGAAQLPHRPLKQYPLSAMYLALLQWTQSFNTKPNFDVGIITHIFSFLSKNNMEEIKHFSQRLLSHTILSAKPPTSSLVEHKRCEAVIRLRLNSVTRWQRN